MVPTRLALLAVMAVALAGCAGHVQLPLPKAVDISAAEYGRVFQAAMAELRDEGFSLDRQEYRFGLLTTRPLPSPTMFEPWKQLNSTEYQAYRATLTDQRRIVAVHITPLTSATRPASAPSAPPTTQPANGFRVSIDVRIEQAQLPNRRLSGSTSGPQIINTLTATPDELRERGIRGPYWQPAGHDPFLAERILTAVMRRATQPGENPPIPTAESSDAEAPPTASP